MKNCLYQDACEHHRKYCDGNIDNCKTKDTLDSILNREVFKSRINKRIFRQEHNHYHYEVVKF